MIGERRCGVAVIGGGPAGLAAAISACEAGCRNVVLVERDRLLGGILNQCIHDGFGLHRFGEAMTGPEYAQRDIDRFGELGLEAMTGSMVLELSKERELLVSRRGEMVRLRADAVVLAMGCRERPRGALSIPGTRPSGIYTAGAAQNLVNLENMMPGKKICILGSGDIGLIMARRMTLEGAGVEAVFELLPYSSGLPRNIQQCLNDYGIPLYLSTTVTDIVGDDRLEAVQVSRVDERRRPIPGTERIFECDTLLLSVGLIPENELTRMAGIEMNPATGGAAVDDNFMTSVPGIFSCGNVLHVHDLVDWVSLEAAEAGARAAAYALGQVPRRESIVVRPGAGVRYTTPSRLSGEKNVSIAFRLVSPGRDRCLVVSADGREILREKRVRLHPAVMEHLRVKAADLKGCCSLEVSVQ
ncbi:FAD-dependent oxidoreductase [Pyramidobacter sp. SM-530-WT-4B]|uniref:FAD-dependent oxidoreductase n=1 Tax=Pyramidobacter porci TaxID=2605789 RepID=A0A6L5Y9Z3_9BACT|nr:FAD-dependent oxidoreductase [Pyramidobacter porci]MCI6260319.1 NAD(P)/FAD-dependent oxidoreductase [Pyramidobacter sp.]MST55114.1 FAD-dependent oxidoreductase [Pyramidobacter porci]